MGITNIVNAAYAAYFSITAAVTLFMADKLRRRGYLPAGFYLVCMGFAVLVAPGSSTLGVKPVYAIETASRSLGAVLVVIGIAYGTSAWIGARTPRPKPESNGHRTETRGWTSDAPIGKVLD